MQGSQEKVSLTFKPGTATGIINLKRKCFIYMQIRLMSSPARPGKKVFILTIYDFFCCWYNQLEKKVFPLHLRLTTPLYAMLSKESVRSTY